MSGVHVVKVVIEPLITDQPVCVRRRLLLEQASKFQAYCMCQTPDLGQRFGQNGFGQRRGRPSRLGRHKVEGVYGQLSGRSVFTTPIFYYILRK